MNYRTQNQFDEFLVLSNQDYLSNINNCILGNQTTASSDYAFFAFPYNTTLGEIIGYEDLLNTKSVIYGNVTIPHREANNNAFPLQVNDYDDDDYDDDDYDDDDYDDDDYDNDDDDDDGGLSIEISINF